MSRSNGNDRNKRKCIFKARTIVITVGKIITIQITTQFSYVVRVTKLYSPLRQGDQPVDHDRQIDYESFTVDRIHNRKFIIFLEIYKSLYYTYELDMKLVQEMKVQVFQISLINKRSTSYLS